MFRMLLQIVAIGAAVSLSLGALWVGLCYACEAVSYVKQRPGRIRGTRGRMDPAALGAPPDRFLQ
jgi:hypothetical protein